MQGMGRVRVAGPGNPGAGAQSAVLAALRQLTGTHREQLTDICCKVIAVGEAPHVRFRSTALLRTRDRHFRTYPRSGHSLAPHHRRNGPTGDIAPVLRMPSSLGCAQPVFSLFFSVAQATDRTRDAVQRSSTRVSWRCAVSESDYSRKHALECMRLAADSMQLAGDVQNPALQSHFVRMARVWSDLAVRGPNGDTRMESAYPDSE